MRERFHPDETPTTQDVLDRWMHAGTAYSAAQQRAEFYRWLADHDNTIVAQFTQRDRAVEAAGVTTDTHWSNGMPRLLTPEAYERLRSRPLGDAPQMSSEQTNERDELILTVRDVDADYHGTGPLALSGAEAALIADAVLAAGYHRDAPTGGE